MRRSVKPIFYAFAAVLAVYLAAPSLAASADQPRRVTVTGEVIDPWCYLSEIMWATGSAHHQCAVWCARGGIPVGILGDDEQVYIVLKVENDAGVIGHHGILRVQSNEVVVEGDLYERDSIRYLAIDTIIDDHGIVNYSHEEFDIQPFGE
ncbi:MAG: hypothetical protein QGI52_04315 [Alphaproteobacteria bacterium]|nr:hypothetical protein [Alphaproteobacteria bacterium]